MPPISDNNHAQIGGILLGVGMGGFLDGILLHQILQWHNMLSSVMAPETMEAMPINMHGTGSSMPSCG
jgi:uncharacterized membrane protein